MRGLLALVLLLAVWGAVPVPLAEAQDRRPDRPPTELWEAYPLDETAPASPPAGPERRERPTPASPREQPADEGGGVDAALPLAILIGVLALLVGLLAGALMGRRNRVVSGTAVPVAQGVVAEGTSNARSVGRFRGTVHAIVLGRRGFRRAPDARYLVSDPAKQDPFWVSQDEVANIVPPARTSPFQRTRPGVQQVRALGYMSVPANDALQSAKFDAQLDAIDGYCDEHGWELVEVVREVETSAGWQVDRQGLLYVLQQIGRGEASCVIVSELGRLSSSAAALGGILDRLQRSDGRLVALDIGLDTASPEGRVAAQALTAVSSWEQDRGRKGLAAAAARSAAVLQPQGVQDVPALKERIATMRAAGMTLQAIADVLNSEGVPTLRGGAMWRPSSVQVATGYRRPSRRPGGAPSKGQDDPEGQEP